MVRVRWLGAVVSRSGEASVTMVRLLSSGTNPCGSAVPPCFPADAGLLTRYVYIPLPLISGGKPGIVYSAPWVPFGMRLRRDLHFDLAPPAFHLVAGSLL